MKSWPFWIVIFLWSACAADESSSTRPSTSEKAAAKDETDPDPDPLQEPVLDKEEPLLLPGQITEAECNQQGLAWIPVPPNTTNPPECGDPLVKWTCCVEQVLVNFPDYKDQLDSKFKERAGEGYHFYDCSSDGTSTKVHWWANEGNELLYKVLTIPQVVTQATETVTCEAL